MHDTEVSLLLAISALERETGLTKDTLRKWEARYGFPVPYRDVNGQRFYSRSDLDRLQKIKRLLDNGARPAKTVPLSIDALTALAAEQCLENAAGEHTELLNQVWGALQAPDAVALKQALSQSLASYGLRTFVLAIMPLLNQMVSNGWVTERIAVHQEHLYSEMLRNLLQDALGRLQPIQTQPKVILATPPDERHDLGILALQSVLALTGAQCISLGTELPVSELIAAARSHQVQIVAVSFSIAYPSRRIAPFLKQIRQGLPDTIQVWAGGAGLNALRFKPEGIRTFSHLEDAAVALTRGHP